MSMPCIEFEGAGERHMARLFPLASLRILYQITANLGCTRNRFYHAEKNMKMTKLLIECICFFFIHFHRIDTCRQGVWMWGITERQIESPGIRTARQSTSSLLPDRSPALQLSAPPRGPILPACHTGLTKALLYSGINHHLPSVYRKTSSAIW